MKCIDLFISILNLLTVYKKIKGKVTLSNLCPAETDVATFTSTTSTGCEIFSRQLLEVAAFTSRIIGSRCNAEQMTDVLQMYCTMSRTRHPLPGRVMYRINASIPDKNSSRWAMTGSIKYFCHWRIQVHFLATFLNGMR